MPPFPDNSSAPDVFAFAHSVLGINDELFTCLLLLFHQAPTPSSMISHHIFLRHARTQ